MTPLAIFAAILGAMFLVLAFVYFVDVPDSLPSFLPGYKQGVVVGHHYTHAVVAIVIALALLGFTWFQTATRRS